jgi:hypothetical protein
VPSHRSSIQRSPGLRAGAFHVTDQAFSSGVFNLLVHESELQKFGALQGRKIVIRHKRQHGFAVGGLMNCEALHIVDFKAQVSLEYDWAVDECLRLEVSDVNASDLNQ